MPTYDYACQACGHEFEAFQSITAKTLRKCPECSKLRLKRLIGMGAGVIFRGSGFYETDYRSDSYRESAKADKADKDTGTKGKPGSASTTSGDKKLEADAARTGTSTGADKKK